MTRRVPIERLYLGLYDGPHATPKPSEEGPVFLGIGNLTEDGKLDLTDIRHIAEEDFAAWTKRVTPQPGDIVFTYEATLNRYALIPSGFRGCLGRRLALIRPDSQKVNPLFLFYYFFGEDWRRTISKNTLSGATVDRIPLTTFPTFEIDLPSRSSQNRIASVLSAYDELIDNNIHRIKILTDMAQTIYREWFVNFRFPCHQKVKMVGSPIGRIPEGWRIDRVKDFGEVITGKTPPKERSDFFGTAVPFIKLPDMHGKLFVLDTNEYLSFSGQEYQKTKTIPADSLCVSCIGTAGIVVITTRPSQTNQQINSVVLTTLRDREFLYFRLLDLKETMNRYGYNGATMVNLNKTKFENLELARPQSALVNQFHEIVSPLFDLILNLQQQNINLCKSRNLLLRKLISGDITVEQSESEAVAQGV